MTTNVITADFVIIAKIVCWEGEKGGTFSAGNIDNL